MIPHDDTHFGGQDYWLVDEYHGRRSAMDTDPLTVPEDDIDEEQQKVRAVLFLIVVVVVFTAITAGLLWRFQ